MEQIEEHVDEMTGLTDILVLQNDLARLDREWEAERNGLMVKGKNGHAHVPSRTQATVLYMVAPLFVAMGFWAYSQSGTWMMLLLSLGVGVVVIFSGSATMAKAKAFEAARARHQTARAALESELATAAAKRKSKKREVKSDPDV